jgi:hypothetical protein
MSGSVGDDHSAARDHREDDRDPSLGGDPGDTDQFDVLLQIHTRFADLQKREHDLSQRLQRTEQERNDLRLRLDHAEAGGGLSRACETQTGQQLQSVDHRLQEIETREAAVDERQRIVEEQQQELREQQQEFARAEEQLKLRSHEVDAEQSAASSDRSTLRARIEREIEIERTALLQLQSTLEAEKQQHVDALSVKKRAYDEALAGLEARLEQEREQIRESLIPVIEAEMREKLGTIDEARQAIDLERETNLDELRRQASELEEQRDEFEQRMAIEREQLENDFERQRHELQDEKALFQKRYRFQFDHLQQSREELEESLRVHRREEQAFRIDSHHFESQLQRRMKQVDEYLDVIRDREESAERQARRARQTLREQLRELSVDRDGLAERQIRWEEERSAQQADLTRQEKLLSSQALNLGDRRVRLEELRLELEDTHQTTLEMRMAVEEAFAQLAQANGAEPTRSRIEAARAAVADHYRHIREGITKQRAEIASSQSQVQMQQDEFRVEREQLTQWMAERDERQRTQQSELDQQVESIDDWESKWRQARDAWKQERMEAEHVIRDLLRQLTALQVPGLDEDDVRLSLTGQPATTDAVDSRQDAGQLVTASSVETDHQPVVSHAGEPDDDNSSDSDDSSLGGSLADDPLQDLPASRHNDEPPDLEEPPPTEMPADLTIDDEDLHSRLDAEAVNELHDDDWSDENIAAEDDERFSPDFDDEKEAA